MKSADAYKKLVTPNLRKNARPSAQCVYCKHPVIKRPCKMEDCELRVAHYIEACELCRNGRKVFPATDAADMTIFRDPCNYEFVEEKKAREKRAAEKAEYKSKRAAMLEESSKEYEFASNKRRREERIFNIFMMLILACGVLISFLVVLLGR